MLAVSSVHHIKCPCAMPCLPLVHLHLRGLHATLLRAHSLTSHGYGCCSTHCLSPVALQLAFCGPDGVLAEYGLFTMGGEFAPSHSFQVLDRSASAGQETEPTRTMRAVRQRGLRQECPRAGPQTGRGHRAGGPQGTLLGKI